MLTDAVFIPPVVLLKHNEERNYIWQSDIYQIWYFKKGTRSGKVISTRFGTLRKEPDLAERYLPDLVLQERNKIWQKEVYQIWNHCRNHPNLVIEYCINLYYIGPKIVEITQIWQNTA